MKRNASARAKVRVWAIAPCRTFHRGTSTRPIAFYGQFGFQPAFRDATWVILRFGDLELEFFPFPALVPAQSSFQCSVRVGDLDDLYRRIQAAGVPESPTGHPRLHAIRLQPWGRRAAFLIDIDGTQLNLIENGDTPAAA